MGVIKDSFTFDDVSLVPQYSSVLPSEKSFFNLFFLINKLTSNS